MNINQKNRLLIIGASVLQLPAIIKAKTMGLYVGVVDHNPQAIGILYADEYFNVSTNDEEGVFRAAEIFKANGIITLATDMPMRSVAYTCEKLGLTGISYETAVKATDKAVMIKAFETHSVEHPWYYVVENSESLDCIEDVVSYPCICKPIDNSGSRGVILVQNQSELSDAIAYASLNGRSGKVIIEEYLLGNEVSVEIIVFKGEVHVLAVTDKLTTGAPHFVEMGHSQPSRIPLAGLQKISSLAVRAVKAIGICNGAAHVEIMLTDRGPKMIELGARLGGDCITSHLVPLSTGIDMVKAVIQIAIGEEPNLKYQLQKGASIRYLDSPCGILLAIDGVEEARKMDNIVEVILSKKQGDLINPITSSLSRIGHVIAIGNSAHEAIENCLSAASIIRFEVQQD